MNKVIIYGEIVSRVDFKFIYDRFKNDNKQDEKYNYTSDAKSKIKLLNESIVEIYGYDKMADYMYRNLKENSIILIIGRLDNDGRVETHEIIHF